MARSYRHIQQYEKEIMELREQDLTLRQIGEKLGFSKKQLKSFITRYNEKQRKIAAGVALHILLQSSAYSVKYKTDSA